MKNGLEDYSGEKITSPLKAIKAKCLDCVCNQRQEIELCTVTNCALFPFRFGKNPYSTRSTSMTEEQRQKAADRLRKARESKQ